MDATLAIMIAPQGCFSASSGIGTIQRQAQSYIRVYPTFPTRATRAALIKRILLSADRDKAVRAAVECYFYSVLHVTEWHHRTDAQKETIVSEFINNVRNAAARRLKGEDTFQHSEVF